MKLRKTIVYQFIGLILTFPVMAESLSPCQSKCFAKKHACREDTSIVWNTNKCSQQQFACRMSCETGRKMAAYSGGASDFKISFKPIIEETI